MNFDKIAILLKKINRVVETLKDADIEVSGIEQELILSYIRELQSAVLEGSGTNNSQSTPTAPKPTEVQVVEEKKIADPEAGKEEAIKVKPAQEERPVEPAHEKPAAPIIEKALEPEVKKPEPVVEKPEPIAPKAEPVTTPAIVAGDELMELFDIKPGTELSDILSFSPIKDLRKSMGVNERIFTINELFNGDQRLFDEVIQHLNGLNDFSTASEYLINKVAVTNHWETKDKKKKADHFVRLVYRRYL